MTEKKIRMEFTEQELRDIYDALNTYSLEQISLSVTWANPEAERVLGRMDVWHRNAYRASALQTRFHKSLLRVRKATTTAEPVVG